MSSRAIRRSALIAPFGVGALQVTPEGTARITAGLDFWLQAPAGSDPKLFDAEEFKFKEWRLERELQVDYFVLPPDFRERRAASFDQARKNTDIRIPLLRFPQWHVCPDARCGKMEQCSLTLRETPRCKHCPRAGRRALPLVQSQFVGICEDGHLQDFPWREWVHKSVTPTCQGELRMSGTPGASLASRIVECECGAKRNLGGITEAQSLGGAGEDGDETESVQRSTFVSEHLTGGGERFLCRGVSPWLGDSQGAGCTRPLQGTLRGATNVYFGNVRSAIYLPRGSAAAPTPVIDALSRRHISSTIRLYRKVMGDVPLDELRAEHALELKEFTDAELAAGLAIVLAEDAEERQVVAGDDQETAFRRDEFEVLRARLDEPQLKITPMAVQAYGAAISERCQRLTLVEKLRETRAFAGFTRIQADDSVPLDKRKQMLWREEPRHPNRWLPAYVVYGEGLYLELDEARLRAWEQRVEVAARIKPLADTYARQRQQRPLRDLAITPRFVLLHTLAHVLITELVFDCGYSSASLRERLYVSTDPDAPMAGLLIYTSSGDADGTLGGLVRMGKPGQLDEVLENALRHAAWCSSDPVCMELGASGGQGPDSCNLAACHSCGLLPETSCEHFNRFLDRWVLVGDVQHRDAGFFSGIPS